MYELKNFTGDIKAVMDSKKEKIIVLDVEGYSTVRPYNVGYIVADMYGTVYKRRSFAFLATIWENIRSMINSRSAEEMTKANIEEILQELEKPKRKRKYNIVPCETFVKVFTEDIKRFKVKRLFAYNVNFDKGSLNRLLGNERFNSLGLTYCDIISGILYTKLLTQKYVNYCKDNGYITEKGNVQTKAEVVYRYLTNSADFVEEHTGLADCLIEYEILISAVKAHKKIDWKPCVAWRKLKNFADEHGIDLKT